MSAALLLLVLTGCKKVPEAPKEFNQLCGYLFEHQWDDDQEELGAGLDRMATWLDDKWDPDEQSDGFTVDKLSEEAMDALDDKNRSTKGQVGLSLPTISKHAVIESTYGLVSVDQDEVYPGTYSEYSRDYLSGPDCFIDLSCDRMEAEEWMTSEFGFGLSSRSHSFNQYVWVEMSEGDAMVHRNWQVDPPDVSDLLPAVDEQTYLNIFIPKGKSGAWRVQAQWTVYDPDESVPEDTAKRLVVNFFEDSHDTLEAWLDEHDVP